MIIVSSAAASISQVRVSVECSSAFSHWTTSGGIVENRSHAAPPREPTQATLSPIPLTPHSPAPLPRTIWLIRHGESYGNAGLKAPSTRENPLSDRGHAQAAELAARIDRMPDLIVTTPYIRTLQTAAPLLARLPHVPHEVWDLHEFTYLSAAQYANTSEVDRRPAAKAYWQLNDPVYRHGEGAETFVEFIGRIDAGIERLLTLTPSLTICFTHGYVIKAVVWRLLNPALAISPEAMKDFKAFHSHYAVSNGEIYPFAAGAGLEFQGALTPTKRSQHLD